MGSDLALNIFCAVANPLAAEGMLRIVRGTLGSRDLRKQLPSLALPLVLIQVLLKHVGFFRRNTRPLLRLLAKMMVC